ncbi:MAG: ATP-dependent helicase, partial [Bacillota bacterium]|nr:ATP-dependent helicase [Bacillota bacterium]
QEISKQDKTMADVWLLYEQHKDSEGLADFDDLLVRTHTLLCENPKALLEQQQRIKYLLVDEFQDTSKVQYSILRLLAAPENNFCVVGDVDQAIYGWRAARPEYLLSFKEHYPAAKTVMLRENFRSTAPLVTYANRIIVNNKARHPITIEPVRNGGEAPTTFQPETEKAEARAVLKMVHKFREQGVLLEQMAAFYRVNRYARHLVNALIEQQMPFTLWDKGKTFDQHWVIRELLAFLRLSVERNHLPSFQALARRQLKLEDETIGKVTQAVQQGEPLWTAVNRVTVRLKVGELTSHLNKARDLSPGQALDYYLSDLGLKSYLKWYAEKRGVSLNEHLSLCDDMRNEMSDYGQITDYLRFVDKRSATLQQSKTETPRLGHINLMTLHAAKGLEFGCVWLVGVTEGLIPHARSETPEQYEEERRLFYVGCTRAKDNLFIMSPRTLDGKITQRSPFLAEAVGTAVSSHHHVLPDLRWV